MQTFQDYELGRHDEVVRIDTREENQHAISRMADQCKKSIDILSRELDPDLFDRIEFIDAVKKMVLGNSRARVRILVFEPKTIVSRGHRLVNLARTLSSYIDIRKPTEEHLDFNEMLFIADGTGYMHRLHPDRFEATLNFNDKYVSKHLILQFEELWEKASPDINLRSITI